MGHRTPVRGYGIREFKKRKSYTFKLKLKSEADKPGGSNRSRVSNTSRVSNRSRGSDSIVLIEAGASIRGNTYILVRSKD